MKPLCTTCLRLCLFVETPAQTAAPVETKFRRFRRGGDPAYTAAYIQHFKPVLGFAVQFCVFFFWLGLN